MTASIPTTPDELLDTYADELTTFHDTGESEFRVESEEQAMWAARKLRQKQKEITDRAELAAKQIAQIEAWVADANAPVERDVEWFSNLLENYHRGVLANDPKRKTVKAGPGVTLVSRQGQQSWQFDEDLFLPWANLNAPDMVRVKHEIDKTAAKASLTVTDSGTVVDERGEAIEGVVVTPAEVKYSIKVEAAEPA